MPDKKFDLIANILDNLLMISAIGIFIFNICYAAFLVAV